MDRSNRGNKQRRKFGIQSNFGPVILLLSLIILVMSLVSYTTVHLGIYIEIDSNPLADSLEGYHKKNSNARNLNVIDEESVMTKEELISVYYPKEDPIQNPTEIPDGYSTFSACLLVMDDNHRLTEWIAYHYHVLPLRFMIVAVDPRSDVAPTHILNEWRRRGMVIIEWNDRDFWRADLKLKPIPDDAELQTKRDRHRGRQKFFYKQCLIQLKRVNRTWVTLHDSDEFLVYNHAGGDNYDAWENARVLQEAHDTAVFNYKYDAKHSKDTQQKGRRHQRVQPSKIPPPTTAEEGAMIKYIRQEQAAGLKFFQSPCIGIPRLMFGADETNVSQADIINRVPQSFHNKVHRFDTLRYRKHAPRNDFVKNALGKVIIDVSRVDIASSPYFLSLHRPIKKICSAPWHNDWESGLRINHYLGSWESYAFRNDARRGGERSREQWEYKSTTTGDFSDDNIRPWLDGFVQKHGVEKATEWLGRVGLPASYHNPDDEKWKLNADRLISILDSASIDPNITDTKRIAFEDFVRKKYQNQKDELIHRAKKAIAKTEYGKVAIIWKKGEK